MKEFILFPLFTQNYAIGSKVEILENGAKFLSVSVTLLMDKNCIENKQKERISITVCYNFILFSDK